MNFVVIFGVSFFCISLELFLTRLLNFKAWNHVVYIVIPYAILGYGIGSNLFMIFKERIEKFHNRQVLGWILFLLAVFGLICPLILVSAPIKVEYLINLFHDPRAVLMLMFIYSVFMIPFIFIGFIVAYIFTVHPSKSHLLYFWDLVGAGLGALMFFPLINSFAIFHSLIILCGVLVFLSFLCCHQRRMVVGAVIILLGVLFYKYFPEPTEYVIDPAKGWEWIPGYFPKEDYQEIVSRWHPLGRTDIYRVVSPQMRQDVSTKAAVTFEFNVTPLPEFSYVSTNFLAGTPIYKLSKEGLAEHDSKVQLFSQAIEFPYLLLDRPKVLVIGAGGGRDIFMAKSHGAAEVWGAEINPGIYQEMSKGGQFYDYSGQIYTSDNTVVSNEDGRHLVKKMRPGDVDLIVLNGVDTFSGLSSGAYAYAESYLYTKNAIKDYLRVIKDTGAINFTRWLFSVLPREELRLMVICLDALRDSGISKPWEHIILGSHKGWSLFLIKKTPFSKQERDLIFDYWKTHDTELLFPSDNWDSKPEKEINFFEAYVRDLKEGKEKLFVNGYPFDISVVTDDNPFFYKYYKFQYFNPFKISFVHHTGPVVFMTQTLMVIQALVFIILFIVFPLSFLRKTGKAIPKDTVTPFVVYFSCLGVGFMFLEISMMQRFVLLLGSPIHSISVVLSILLISTGLGSLFLPSLERIIPSRRNFLIMMTALLIGFSSWLMIAGQGVFENCMGYPFIYRAILVSIFLFPIGIVLGVFFPLGLNTVVNVSENAIPWAWGINCGFSVLGGILAIIFAQFWGFNIIIISALAIYVLANLAFYDLSKNIKTNDLK